MEEQFCDSRDNLSHYDIDRGEHNKSTISWGAIFAGTLTAIALSILLSFLTAGLGFGAINMHSQNPFSTAGSTFNIVLALALLLSLAAGAFIAGRLARKAGLIHGFLTWAMMSLLTTLLSVYALTATARLASSAISTTFSSASDAISSLSESAMFDNLFDTDGSLQNKIKEATNDIYKNLNNTKIDALQPEHLESVFENSKKDIKNAVSKFKNNPQNFSNIVQNLIQQLKNNAQSITANIDREDVIKELVHKGWSRDGAELAADKALDSYNNVKDSIVNQLNNAEDFLNDAPQNMEEAKHMANEKINDVADGLTSTTLWAFFGGLVCAIISALAGLMGQRSAQNSDLYEYRRTYVR